MLCLIVHSVIDSRYSRAHSRGIDLALHDAVNHGVVTVGSSRGGGARVGGSTIPIAGSRLKVLAHLSVQLLDRLGGGTVGLSATSSSLWSSSCRLGSSLGLGLGLLSLLLGLVVLGQTVAS